MGCSGSKEAGGARGGHVDTAWRQEVVPGVERIADVATSPTFAAGGGGGVAFKGILNVAAADDSREAKQRDIDMQSKKRPSARDLGSNDLSTSGFLNMSKVPRGVVHYAGTAMTMPFQVQAVAPEAARAGIEEAVERVMRVTDSVFNNWNPDSELEASLNVDSRAEKVAVSEELAGVLEAADAMVTLTGGRFDPTVLPVLREWRKVLNVDGRPPQGQEMERFKFCVGWARNVTVARRAGDPGAGAVVSLPNTLTRLDLGGIAKGYAVDLVSDALAGLGIRSFIVEWGGDVRSAGTHPSGRPWRTCVCKPPAIEPLFALWSKERIDQALSAKDVILNANIESGAIATSGDFFQVNRFGYHHIMHPGHRVPLKVNEEGVASATVVAPTCAVADAVATAAMVAGGMEQAERFLGHLKAQGRITGFALLSRTKRPVISGSCFDVVGNIGVKEIAQDQRAMATQPSLSQASPLYDKYLAAKGRKQHEPWVVEVTIKGKSLQVQTMTTLSISPLMVSVIVPASFLSSAVIQGTECVLRVANGEVTGRILGSVSELFDAPGKCTVLSVAVSDVEEHLDGVSAPERLKSLMRRQVVPVSMVMFQAKDATRYAVTASSCRSAAPGCFVFNLQCNSRAGLAVEGMVGSRCGIHYLTGRDRQLAVHHVRDPVITDRKHRELTGGDAASSADGVPLLSTGVSCLCRITRTQQAGDHILVVCALEEVLVGEANYRPLLYRNKEFYESQ